jgi:hypothetical protein
MAVPGSRNRRGQEIRDRLERRGARACTVEGCLKPRHSLSQYCARHAANEQKHGHHLQRAIRKLELKPFAKSASKWLKANEGHGALVLIYAELDRLLSDAALVPITRKPKRADWQAVLRLELQRLHRDGVRGEELFTLILTLHLFSLASPRTLPPWSRQVWFNLSRLVFRMRQHPNDSYARGPADGWRFPVRALEHLGRDLMTRCALVLDAIVKAQHRAADEPARRTATLVEALTQDFSAPSTKSTPTTNPSGNIAALNKE